MNLILLFVTWMLWANPPANPLLLVEWYHETSSVKLSLFPDGTLTLETREKEETLHLSPEALRVYKDALTSIPWEPIQRFRSNAPSGPLSERYRLTLHLNEKTLKVEGSTLDTPPLALGNLLTIAEDLRNLFKKPEKVNPFEERVPQVGDEVVDFHGQVYRLIAIQEKDVYIFEGVANPIRLEIPKGRLSEVFAGYADHRR